LTEQVRSTGNVPNFYNFDVSLELLPCNWLYWVISFVNFLNPSGKFMDSTSK